MRLHVTLHNTSIPFSSPPPVLQGSLRTALNAQRLVEPGSTLPAVHLVLALAHDVACAMLHLHSEHVVHSDLKAGNVLLTKANSPPLGLVAAAAAVAAASGGNPLAGAATAASGSNYSGSSGSGSSHRLRAGSCVALLEAAQAAAGGRLVAKVRIDWFAEQCSACVAAAQCPASSVLTTLQWAT